MAGNSAGAVVRRIARGVAAVLVGIVVVACGRQGATEAGQGARADADANTAGAKCFLVAGQPNGNDAGLYAASMTGDLPALTQAIAAGANVNGADLLKRTPLFAAVYCSQAQAAGLLIDNGGDVNARDFDDMSPLHAAAIAGGIDVAKVLLAKGADLNSRDADGRTPLSLAAATDDAGMVGLLLAHGANVGLRDKAGLTAAALAAENGHDAIATKLRRAHAAGRAKTSDGLPPHAPAVVVPGAATVAR